MFCFCCAHKTAKIDAIKMSGIKQVEMINSTLLVMKYVDVLTNIFFHMIANDKIELNIIDS